MSVPAAETFDALQRIALSSRPATQMTKPFPNFTVFSSTALTSSRASRWRSNESQESTPLASAGQLRNGKTVTTAAVWSLPSRGGRAGEVLTKVKATESLLRMSQCSGSPPNSVKAVEDSVHSVRNLTGQSSNPPSPVILAHAIAVNNYGNAGPRNIFVFMSSSKTKDPFETIEAHLPHLKTQNMRCRI